MTKANSINLVIRALGRCNKVFHNPYYWVYKSADDTEVVEIQLGKAVSNIIYTKFTKFLWFKIGMERFTISSDDTEYHEWHEIMDHMYNTNLRLKAIS